MSFDNLAAAFADVDHMMASAVSSMGGSTNDLKRGRSDDWTEGDIFERTAKKISLNYDEMHVPAPNATFDHQMGATVPPPLDITVPNKEELQPYPFYYYRDFSREIDEDPLTPLTPPGRVPNFPAKMHAILSRDDLSDVISWMPHGRAWRVLKPREFEVRVIPSYFEHSKFSSFIRQANGWGFRRITQGRDRNSYYHPLFMRGLPHLCKKMRRPGVSEKHASDPDHEPDLYKISEMNPVPEKADDASIMLHCTLQAGPKARVPIYSGLASGPGSKSKKKSSSDKKPSAPTLTPSDQYSLAAFQQSLGASEAELKKKPGQDPPLPPPVSYDPQDFIPVPVPAPAPQAPPPLPPLSTANGQTSHLALANQLAFAGPSFSNMAQNMPAPTVPPDMAAAFQNNPAAASQFAAGFAAATALSHQQFQAMLASLGAGMNGSNPPSMPPNPFAPGASHNSNPAAPAPATQQPQQHAPQSSPAPAPARNPAPAPATGHQPHYQYQHPQAPPHQHGHAPSHQSSGIPNPVPYAPPVQQQQSVASSQPPSGVTHQSPPVSNDPPEQHYNGQQHQQQVPMNHYQHSHQSSGH